MSASREKRTRKDVVAAPFVEQKKTMSKSTILAIAAIALSVILIACIVIFKGPMLKKSTTAMTVGSHELSPVEVRYFYTDLFNGLMNSGYGSYMSLLYPNGIEHLENESFFFSDTATWGEYLRDQLDTQIRATYAIYDEAVASGYTLTEEDEAELESTKTYIQYYAYLSGMSSEDTYLVNYYGSGSSLESYLDYARVCLLVSSYSGAKQAGIEVTAEEMAAKEAEAPTDYNNYTYHVYSVSAKYETGADEAAIAVAMAEAKAAAEVICDASVDLDTYLTAVGNDADDVEGYADGKKTLRANYTTSSIPEDILDWVTDNSRKEGDVAVCESTASNLYYVVYFTAAEDNDYCRVNAHMVQVTPFLNDDGSVEEEATAERAQQLQAAYNELAANNDSEDDLFSDLAYQYSTNDTTAFTNITKGTYGAEFDAWLFDSARAAGETALINSNGTWYFVCFDGAEEQTYRSLLIDSAIREDKYSAWYMAAVDTVTLTENSFGMKQVDFTLNYSAS